MQKAKHILCTASDQWKLLLILWEEKLMLSYHSKEAREPDQTLLSFTKLHTLLSAWRNQENFQTGFQMGTHLWPSKRQVFGPPPL